MLQTLTVDESPFQNAKPRPAARIAYKAFAEVAGKASFFVITIVAARRLTAAAFFRIDVFLVEAWNGTESVALYNTVFRLVEALRLFPAVVLAVTLPGLCSATDARPLARVSILVTGFAIVAAGALWLFAPWTVAEVYGSRYAAAIPAFRILLMAFPLMSLNYALTTQLIGWDGHRAYVVLCGIALAFNLTVNARLIPALSIEGAAWTTLATEVMLTIGCLAALARAMRTNPAARSLALAGPAEGAAL